MEQEIVERGIGVEEIGEEAVAEEIGDLIPVADRVDALVRQVGPIVGCFAHLLYPAHQAGAAAGTGFLLLFVELLLGENLPEVAEVGEGGDQSKADATADRNMETEAGEERVELIEVVLNRRAGEVAGGDNVRDGGAVEFLGAFRFCEMNFEEIVIAVVEAMEGNESLNGASPFGPAAADSTSESYDSQLAGEECLLAGTGIAWVGFEKVGRPDIFDVQVGRQDVFSEADAVGKIVGTETIMGLGIEAKRVEEAIDFVVAGVVVPLMREEPFEEWRGEVGIAGGDSREFGAALVAQIRRRDSEQGGHCEEVVFAAQQGLVAAMKLCRGA